MPHLLRKARVTLALTRDRFRVAGEGKLRAGGLQRDNGAHGEEGDSTPIAQYEGPA
jgi:hypothetical protein